jgi:NAD(P)-dependent dehydrogenase (short-subunit alcohol dehydrogenase family)
MSGSDLFELSRRVALVTGGNGGIGLGMAKGLTEAGASVAIAGRDNDHQAARVSRCIDEQLPARRACTRDLRLSQLCLPCATPSSNFSLD